jgi:hypothetical protein
MQWTKIEYKLYKNCLREWTFSDITGESAQKLAIKNDKILSKMVGSDQKR